MYKKINQFPAPFLTSFLIKTLTNRYAFTYFFHMKIALNKHCVKKNIYIPSCRIE